MPDRHRGDAGRETRERSAAPLGAEQARMARALFTLRREYKAIDAEVAARATALLREMADGGDIDVTRFTALAQEAARGRAAVEMRAPVQQQEEDDITFVRQEVPAARAEPVRAVERGAPDAWEAWRAHLVGSGAIAEDGSAAHRRPEELGLTREQLDYIVRLQQNRHISEGASRSAVAPRMAG